MSFCKYVICKNPLPIYQTISCSQNFISNNISTKTWIQRPTPVYLPAPNHQGQKSLAWGSHFSQFIAQQLSFNTMIKVKSCPASPNKSTASPNPTWKMSVSFGVCPLLVIGHSSLCRVKDNLYKVGVAEHSLQLHDHCKLARCRHG